MARQQAEMRMVRWMCNVKVKDLCLLPSKELREKLRIDDMILILQQNRLRWHGHVLRKEDRLCEEMYGILEMWANAQRDSRPAEYRWRPLFNAAVWLTPTTR